MSTSNNTTTVDSADILRLITSFLQESGLTESASILRQESGVGSAGFIRAVHSNIQQWAARGEWGMILQSLSSLDTTTNKLDLLMADVHEMAILELAEAGEIRLAYASLRLVEDLLDRLPAGGGTTTTSSSKKSNEYSLSRKRDLEQRLAALVSLRSTHADSNTPTVPIQLPRDYYGPANGPSKQQRREQIGLRLVEAIPMVPPARLISLLQQAMKWQAFTGQLPRIQNLYHNQEEESIMNVDDNQQQPPNNKKRKRKVFDLVLGQVDVDPVNVGDVPVEESIPLDPIPTKPYTTIKFGKKATCESAVFSPDETATGSVSGTTTTFSLVTGSSDGLVELYDAHSKYSQLRMDLPYQESEELLGHDEGCPVLSVAVSNDGSLLASGDNQGHVKIWRIATGKCLRKIKAHDRSGGSAITCLAFSPDMSHLLTASQDTLAREFGLRTARMLKEFEGHVSYITSCQYVLRKGGHELMVVTSSADGTVRLWNAKTSDVIRVFRPISLGDPNLLSAVKTSLVVDHRSDLTAGAGGSPGIHSVLSLHTPADTMIVVPRGKRAFLVTTHGIVLRVFEDDVSSSTGGDNVFVAATVSPSNHWLYCVTDLGVCCVFDVATGKLETSLRQFGDETTSKSKGAEGTEGAKKQRSEITQLLHHPQKGILAAFSNDKGQKKGQLVLWK